MAKEKAETKEKENESEICTSVFKNETLTKEEYTQVWIELISALERRKSVNFSPNQ